MARVAAPVTNAWSPGRAERGPAHEDWQSFDYRPHQHQPHHHQLQHRYHRHQQHPLQQPPHFAPPRRQHFESQHWDRRPQQRTPFRSLVPSLAPSPPPSPPLAAADQHWTHADTGNNIDVQVRTCGGQLVLLCANVKNVPRELLQSLDPSCAANVHCH